MDERKGSTRDEFERIQDWLRLRLKEEINRFLSLMSYGKDTNFFQRVREPKREWVLLKFSFRKRCTYFVLYLG